MWSKLLPREESKAVQPLLFQTLNGGQTQVRPAQSGPVTAPAPTQIDAGQRERDQLRTRVTELEQALAQQVAAARQTGYREGELAGRSQAEASVKSIIDRLSRSIQEVVDSKPRIRKELEEDAVRLSLGIAKRVIRRELSVDPAALHGLVQAAFERAARSEVTRVVVHPDHVTPVRDALAQLSSRPIEIFADAGREKGTLIFESTRGALDASVESQLREIELGLADRLKWR